MSDGGNYDNGSPPDFRSGSGSSSLPFPTKHRWEAKAGDGVKFADGAWRKMTKQTVCIRGHKQTPENICVLWNGRKHCKVCKKEARERRKKR